MPETIIYAAGALQGLMQDSGYTWLRALAPLMGVIAWDAAQGCMSDPEPRPDITAADWISLINISNPFLYAAAAEKFAQLVRSLLWEVACWCPDGGTTPPPAAQAPVMGLPTPFGGNPSSGPATPCFEQLSAQKGFFAAPASGVWNGWFPFGQGVAGQTLPIPTGATLIQVDVETVCADPTGPRGEFNIRVVNSGANTTRQAQFPTVCGTESNVPLLIGGTATVNINPGDDRFAIEQYFGNSYVTTDEAAVRVRFFCGNAPGQVQTACCPPDDTVMGLLLRTLQTVTLIQRESVPFAYIRGTAHAGLHDNGFIDVQGLLGIIVTLTTTPGWVGVESGEPNALFEAGWFNWGTADGYSERVAIHASPQISLPAAAGQYTRVGYTLSPGVVATITELVRES